MPPVRPHAFPAANKIFVNRERPQAGDGGRRSWGGRPVSRPAIVLVGLSQDRLGAAEFSAAQREAAAIPPTIPNAIAAIAAPLVHCNRASEARAGPASRPYAIPTNIAKWQPSAASASIRRSCPAPRDRPAVMALRPIHAGAANSIMRQVAGHVRPMPFERRLPKVSPPTRRGRGTRRPPALELLFPG
jgi:hypothetical protein